MLFKEASRWLTPVLTVSMLRLVATEAAQLDSRNWPNNYHDLNIPGSPGLRKKG